jgi:hypothetical protein
MLGRAVGLRLVSTSRQLLIRRVRRDGARRYHCDRATRTGGLDITFIALTLSPGVRRIIIVADHDRSGVGAALWRATVGSAE